MTTACIRFCVIASVLACGLPAQEISAPRIRAHVKFLSSDLLEGRGVGVRGGRLTTEYLATAFALAGAQPGGDNGTWFQNVTLTGVETEPTATLSAVRQGKTVSFRWTNDFVGINHRQQPQAGLDAEAVFVGHGITAPEFNWDDYKNTDVRGKVVVLFTNEPPSTDPAFFGGPALTYYGRWTYKYEEALRRGAIAAIIIHTDETAGYGWDVVRSSWGRENPYVKLQPNETALVFAGWVTRGAGERLLSLSGQSVDALLRAAGSRGFQPIPLGIRIRAAIPSKIRQIETRNVAALIPGSDPALKDQVVLFTAHWDHLGNGTAVNGDSIYNGAVDNATGCGILVELARAWAELPQKPRRSALFLAVTAEEGGLRGSEFYAANPIFPPGKTAVALNFDAIHPLGRTSDVVVTGSERTTLRPVVEAAARRMNLTIKPDPRPEQGIFYRSDHFSLAKVGIPAFTVDAGSDFLGKPADFGRKIFSEFNTRHYHQPSDEYREDWDFSGLAQIARFGMLIAIDAANQDVLPTWNPGDEFLEARRKSGVK